MRFIPSGPRCKQCSAPFGPPGKWIMGRLGFSPWEKNPKICRYCLTKLGGREGIGAEVELSLMFADVRGSSRLARTIGDSEFRRLMSRFYEVAADVLIESDALLDKFVGDQVIGLFVPGIAGPDHARRAIEAARAVLRDRPRLRRGSVGPSGSGGPHRHGLRRDRSQPGRGHRLHGAG